MTNDITFILKATDDKSSLGRCLKSLYRQSNKNFSVIVITNLKKTEIASLINSTEAEFIYIDKKKDFFGVANNRIKELKSRYFMYINSDSVIPPNAVEVILNHDEDTVVFNLSKQDKNGKFTTVYPENNKFSLSEYIRCGASIWNNAICTEYVINEGLFLSDWAYFSQLIYLLRIYSGVRTICIIPDVLVYRAVLITKKKISYEQFSSNRQLLGKILKGFTVKNMNDVKKQIIADFVLSNIDEYYNEKRLVFRLVKKHRFRKFICM
ncbi:MAG: glycosyltransferase [Acutalibacteraceae bacterium]|nr:glycosyltransferase [Acutalibacteraceae bacterium]